MLLLRTGDWTIDFKAAGVTPVVQNNISSPLLFLCANGFNLNLVLSWLCWLKPRPTDFSAYELWAVYGQTVTQPTFLCKRARLWKGMPDAVIWLLVLSHVEIQVLPSPPSWESQESGGWRSFHSPAPAEQLTLCSVGSNVPVAKAQADQNSCPQPFALEKRRRQGRPGEPVTDWVTALPSLPLPTDYPLLSAVPPGAL